MIDLTTIPFALHEVAHVYGFRTVNDTYKIAIGGPGSMRAAFTVEVSDAEAELLIDEILSVINAARRLQGEARLR